MLVKDKSKRKLTNDEVFIDGSLYARHHIKRRLIEDNLVEYICAGCGNDGTWKGEPLILQLEHKNGVNNDNRVENLEFLCPNCHTQTKTYAAKNRKNPLRVAKRY